MVSEKQIEAFITAYCDADTSDMKESVIAGLTAAEQAEPSPAARLHSTSGVSGAVKVNVLKYHLAQFRHAYSHLKSGSVVDQATFADGLIAPGIAALEQALTAAEQAKPAPAARSGAVKVKRPERVQAAFEVFKGREDTGPNATALFEYIEHLEADLEPAEPAPAAEPVAYGVKASNTMRFSSVYLACDYEHGDLGSYRKDLIVPLFTRPPESRLREAAREAVNCLTHHAEDNENTRWVLSLLNAALKEASDY